MTPARRRKAIERAALYAARRAQKRSGTPLTREELLALKVQTAPWWLRGFVVLLGALFTAGGMAGIADGSSAGVVMGLLGLLAGIAVIITGWIGRKRTLESILETFGGDIAEAILRLILDALN